MFCWIQFFGAIKEFLLRTKKQRNCIIQVCCCCRLTTVVVVVVVILLSLLMLLLVGYLYNRCCCCHLWCCFSLSHYSETKLEEKISFLLDFYIFAFLTPRALIGLDMPNASNKHKGVLSVDISGKHYRFWWRASNPSLSIKMISLL